LRVELAARRLSDVLTSLAPLSHPGLVLAQFTMLYLDFVDDASIPREAS